MPIDAYSSSRRFHSTSNSDARPAADFARVISEAVASWASDSASAGQSDGLYIEKKLAWTASW
ncbi:hypothetical protein ACIBL3_17725 [Kribbella sp. NPDC050124]|uniref:hypothetical protein n=1 Tax=Kribbella sp. NPDC050124 TaxID=3364114 RepID=UPI0037958647